MGGLPKSTLKVIVQGQEQDIVQRLVPPGAALAIENMFFDHQGNLVKRYGSASLGASVVPTGAAMPVPWALGKHQGTLVLLGREGHSPLAVRDQSHSAWMVPAAGTPGTAATSSWNRGPMVATIQKLGAVKTYGNSYDHHDIAIGNGYLAITYQEQSPAGALQVHEVLVDVSTGRCIMDFTAGAAGHQMFPHVQVVGNRWACFAWNDHGTLTVGRFDLTAADPTTTGSTVSLSNDIVTDSPLDLAEHSNGLDLLVAYQGQSGQFRAATIRPSTLAASAVNLKTQSGTAIAAAIAFAWAQNLDGATWANGYPALVTCSGSTGVVEHLGWTASGGDFNAGRTTVVDSSSGATGATSVAAATSASGTGTNVPLDILWYTTTAYAVPVVNHASVSGSGAVVVDTNVTNAYLASKMFRDAVGKTCFLVGITDANQATYYVMPLRQAPSSAPGNTDYPAPLCRTEVQTAANAPDAAHLTSVVAFGLNTVYTTAAIQIPMGIAAAGPALPITATNVDVIKIQFRNGIEPTLPAPILGNPVEAIDSMFVPGGQLMQWDGKAYGHGGFSYAPTAPNVTGGGSGSLTDGYNYSYCSVYARRDAQGRIWRSAPSPITQATAGGGAAFSVSAPFLQLVSAPGTWVEFYRDTALLPGEMHRLPGVIPNVHDSPGSPFATINDWYPDTTVVMGELLYTTGGILQNDITPGFTCLAVFDGRLWGVSADDPQALWFSCPLTPPGTGGFLAGAGLFFSADNIVDVRDDRGPITGIGTCDGRMVIFKHDAIYTMEGNGPDNTGAGSTYLVTRIAGNVGCDNPRSIVDAFDGVWFQSSSSRAGIWRLDRGISLQYLGQGVRDLASLPVVGGVAIPEQSQIRWYTYGDDAGSVLVYDVIAQSWGTFTSPSAATSASCAINWGGAVVWGSESTGAILLETIGTYTDAGAVFGQRAVLPWLQMADLQGYQRVYSYQGIGACVADHQLKVNLYRDLLDSDVAFASQDFSMVAASNPRWEWEIRFPMKLSAVKVEIISEPTNTAGFAFSGIAVEYGQKVGLKPTVYTHRLTHS